MGLSQGCGHGGWFKTAELAEVRAGHIRLIRRDQTVPFRVEPCRHPGRGWGVHLVEVTPPGTGNSEPSPEIRELVLARDSHTCVCGCRRPVTGQQYSLGHRKRASQGGRAVPSNLLTFFGRGGEECHGRIDRRDDPRDEKRGLTVRSWQDPAQVPVTVTRPDGSEETVYLWDDGTCQDRPQAGPESRAA